MAQKSRKGWTSASPKGLESHLVSERMQQCSTPKKIEGGELQSQKTANETIVILSAKRQLYQVNSRLVGCSLNAVRSWASKARWRCRVSTPVWRTWGQWGGRYASPQGTINGHNRTRNVLMSSKSTYRHPWQHGCKANNKIGGTRPQKRNKRKSS